MPIVDERYRYTYMLAGLLLLLLIDPITEQFYSSLAAFVIDLTLLLPLVIGIWGLSPARAWYRGGQILVVVTIVLQAVNLGFIDHRLDPVVLTLVMVFALGSSTIALRDVLFGGPIDVNRLIGAVCVYLLIGVAWGIAYYLYDLLTTASGFTGIEPGADISRISEYIYFSFVTLTTLGYGDISPVTPFTRSLAYLEAACGQLYLTILVAALVGMLLARPAGDEATR